MAEKEQIDEAAILDQAKSGKVTLVPLTPVEREKVARWIESKYSKLPVLIERGEELLRKGLGPPSLAEQIHYWRAALAVSKQLAYYARIERGGPLSGV